MSNLFEGRKIYGEKWNVKEERDFNAEELDMVSRAQVVDSDYGLSCCFTMTSGGVAYIPMAKDSNVHVGDIVDLTKAKALTLERTGEQDICRVYYDRNV